MKGGPPWPEQKKKPTKPQPKSNRERWNPSTTTTTTGHSADQSRAEKRNIERHTETPPIRLLVDDPDRLQSQSSISFVSLDFFFNFFLFFFVDFGWWPSLAGSPLRFAVRLFVIDGGIRRHSAAFGGGGGGGGGGRWEAYRRLIYGHSGRRQRNAPLFSFPLFFLFHFYYYYFFLFFF